MRNNFLLLIVTIVVGAAITYFLDYAFVPDGHETTQNSNVEDTFKKDMAVPEFSFTDTKDQLNSISDFKGKIVVLNFWASWCAPCLIEMPYFMDLVEEFSTDVVFIGLSSDFKTEPMLKFMDKLAIDKPEAMAQDNVFFAFDEKAQITRDVFQTFRLPETIIIDKKGIMRHKLIGADWKYDELKTLIENLQTGAI